MARVRDADTWMASRQWPEGAEVYRVGGSVRDEILGRRSKDADYVVRNVTLWNLQAVLGRVYPGRYDDGKASALKLRDGRQVGVRVAVPRIGLLEAALPRTEVSTGPGRHDFEIVTRVDLPLVLDSERRDFTINALYKPIPRGSVADPTSCGLSDLRDKIIRTTHTTSFRDDPLRILRALRFISVLPGFELAVETWEEMQEYAESVTGLTQKGVSATALDELTKLLMGKRPEKSLRLMRDSGVLAHFLPELAPMVGFEQNSRYHDMTTDDHTFESIGFAARAGCSLRVRLSLLFHDAGKPEVAWKGDDDRLHYYAMPEKERNFRTANLITIRKESLQDHEEVGARLAREALMRLNAPKKLRDDVVILCRRHMVPLSGRTKAAKVRRWRCELGDDLLADLLKHRLSDSMGKGTVDYTAVSALARLEKIREDAEKAHVPASPKDLPINGRDLMELGLNGPAIGRVQRTLLHEVVSQPDRNEREWLLERASKLAVKERA